MQPVAKADGGAACRGLNLSADLKFVTMVNCSGSPRSGLLCSCCGTGSGKAGASPERETELTGVVIFMGIWFCPGGAAKGGNTGDA